MRNPILIQPPAVGDIRAHVDAGRSIREMALHYNASQRTIQRWLAAYNLKTNYRSGERAASDALVAKIREMRRAGETHIAIHKALGCTHNVIREATIGMVDAPIEVKRSRPSAYAFAMANPFGQAVENVAEGV